MLRQGSRGGRGGHRAAASNVKATKCAANFFPPRASLVPPVFHKEHWDSLLPTFQSLLVPSPVIQYLGFAGLFPQLIPRLCGGFAQLVTRPATSGARVLATVTHNQVHTRSFFFPFIPSRGNVLANNPTTACALL